MSEQFTEGHQSNKQEEPRTGGEEPSLFDAAKQITPPNSVTYNYNNHKLMGFRNSLGQEFGTSLAGGSGAALICRLDWGGKICLQSGSFTGRTGRMVPAGGGPFHRLLE